MDHPGNDALHVATHEWLLGPVLDCIQYLAEEIAITGLFERSTIALSNLPPLLAAARSSARMSFQKQQIDQLLKLAPADAKFAKEEIGRGFPLLRSHSSIGFWAAVESSVENIIMNHIRGISGAEELLKDRCSAEKIRSISSKDDVDSIKRFINAI